MKHKKFKMLNLIPDRIYKVTTFNGGKFTFKVRSKNVHDKTTHSYFGTWQHPSRNYTVGRYFWDHGVANQGINIVFDRGCIRMCKEMFNC